MQRMATRQKVYIAGPMTRLPSFNIPAFDAAAAELRRRGFDVVSPAELDDPALRAEELASPDGNPDGLTEPHDWGTLLGRDLVVIATSELTGVWVLPGWEASRGTRLETFVAHALYGLPIRSYGSGRPVGTLHLVRAWLGPVLFSDLIDKAREAWSNVR